MIFQLDSEKLIKLSDDKVPQQTKIDVADLRPCRRALRGECVSCVGRSPSFAAFPAVTSVQWGHEARIYWEVKPSLGCLGIC